MKKIKKLARKIKLYIVSKEPTSKISKTFIVFSYKLVLILFNKYKKRRITIYEVIKENISEEEYRNKRLTKKLLNEILYCRFMYQIAAVEYFVYEFEKLSHKGRKQYITRGNKYKFYRKFNNQNYIGYFDNKTETYRKFKEFYGRDAVPIYDEKDFSAFEKFVKKHPKFMYKPNNDYGGNGIVIYDSSDYSDMNKLFEIIIENGSCILEELIVQAPEISKIYPDSVNTLRVVAFSTKDKDIVIQWCFFRMGMNGNYTDNMSSGGLGCMVDPKTGIIYTTGRDYLGHNHLSHPNTGEMLVGFQLPKWEEALEMLKTLSQVIPQVRLVGWDLAYTEKGWILIEGNASPQCLTAQISNYNGRLHQFQQIEEIYNKEVNQIE